MHIAKVSIRRIALRERGADSEISIDSELVIIQDDPNADALVQHLGRNVKISTLPEAMQEAIDRLFELCQTRLEQEYNVVRDDR